jgi:hypothetical protein
VSGIIDPSSPWALVLLAGIGLSSQVFGHLEESNGIGRAESVRGLQLLDGTSRHGPGAA